MKFPAICAAAAAILLSASAWADVAVDNVVARQRYPWNGLVDITCTVSGIDGETNGLKLAVAAVMPDTDRTRKVSHFQVERGGKWSDDHEVRTNGNYRLLWDAFADLGPVRFTNMVVRVSFVVHEKVQLWEGGPYWATTNIGADEPWEYGLYFWWGHVVGFKFENGAWVASDGSSSDLNECIYTNSPSVLQREGWVAADNVLASEHDAAQVQWGGGWRMPTYQELSDLCYKCNWTWLTTNGVNGYVVCGKGACVSSRIFLPAAGYGSKTDLVGSDGLFWSSGPCSDYYKYPGDLGFDSWNHNTSYYYRKGGRFSIRPVQGFAE